MKPVRVRSTIGLGLAALLGTGCGLIAQTSLAQQSNVSGVQRQAQGISVQRGDADAQITQRSGEQVQRKVQQDLLRRQRDVQAATLAARQRAQYALQRENVQQQVAGADANLQANQGKPGVDDRPLWNLLRAKRLTQFDQQLLRTRQQFPDWAPPEGLLAERVRQQQDLDIDQALAKAGNAKAGDAAASSASLEPLLQVIQHYPEQFSCTRIDRLWRGAELLAKAGRGDQALTLYRSVFPDCAPSGNRIATLYMAQQSLGADSAAMEQLIALEAAGGKRDADSETKFVRLQYDRSLTRMAAATPDSDTALQLTQQLAPQIENYRDGAAATLSGWIMLAHRRSDEAEIWFQRASGWMPAAVDAQLGLLQIRLERKDIAGAEQLLAQPGVAADPRARAQRARLSMLRADELNLQKDYAASLRALDEAERFGATPQQTGQLRGWNLYGSGRYEQASALFAAQYRSKHEARTAEGWALSESARGRLPELSIMPEAQEAPLQAYVSALESQQLYYRKQFIEAYALQKQAEQNVTQTALSDGVAAQELGKSLQSYLPKNLKGIDSASISTGFTLSNHAGANGQGHLETLAPAVRAEWMDGTRQYNLRLRQLTLNAETIRADQVAQAIGVPASYQASGRVNAQELWFSVDDSLWLTSLGRISWQAALGATDGGAGGSDVYGQLSAGQQTAWGSWSAYAGSNPVRDSLLSWRGLSLPGSGDYWGDVRRNTLGVRSLMQLSKDWSMSANAELAGFSGHNVQSNRSVALDLGAGYNFKLAGFDYFNIGPALHYLHFDNNQNQYSWGLGGYYSPQRSLSTGIASQFMTLEGQSSQLSGNLELGWNSSGESASSCLPVGLPAAFASVNRAAVNCGYSGSRDSGMYAHVQLAMVKRLSERWQIGALGDLNVTPGRDRQYAGMLFVRYFFSARDAVFSRDLPKNTRDFYGQMDDGR
ncbi:cellulose synthase subunit BcsC-related outer membrane protein [Herbaspirillum lusitanum]|uniref:Cellulose synthase subunit BcsC-related outer membrane protein n=1 Tax=Herbaspirillum lusitanum TaxID=213312 RepID=A0ABW9ADE5_9BURK